MENNKGLDLRVREQLAWVTNRSLGIACKLPGLGTVTTEWRTGRRAGLHVDSWFGDRVDRTIRMCVNLGLEARSRLRVLQGLQSCPDTKLQCRSG